MTGVDQRHLRAGGELTKPFPSHFSVHNLKKNIVFTLLVINYVIIDIHTQKEEEKANENQVMDGQRHLWAGGELTKRFPSHFPVDNFFLFLSLC